ncbi:MAG: FecR domain-containing protein [Saprospiraceae bacterium]|nr:FecR domain-containing protein [Saprospiraceae bacterium]
MEKGLASFKNRMSQHQPAKVVRISPNKMALRIAAGVALLLVAGMFIKNKMGSADQQLAVVTTNDTKELSLSDGTVVTLNQSSQLSYKSEFGKEERRAKLNGEAFFKVARDGNRPFVIETETASVRVLGTAFNVRSYPADDLFEVYVETGKVRVDFKKGGDGVVLNPSEFVRLSKSEGEAFKGLDNSGIPNAWRTGVISFKGQSISEIIKGMERLYGKKFVLKTSQQKDCPQTLTVHRGKMEEAFNGLKTSCPKLQFSANGNDGFIVTGVCCD